MAALLKAHFATSVYLPISASVGTEELAHLEMICTMVHQLTKNLSMKQIKEAGLDAYYADHGVGVYPVSAAGDPFTAAYFQSKGDPVTDLYEDMAADAATRMGLLR